MIRTRRKKNNLFKIICLVTLLAVFSAAGVNIGKLVYTKHQNTSLEKEITKIQKDTSNINENNKKLLVDIKQAKEKYKDKTKDLKIAYLTFDDGPSKHTEDILKILKDNDAKATFFVNGHEKLREKYKKIIEDGNVVANHTYSHDYKNIYVSPENFKNDVVKLDNMIKDATGQEPSHMLRYPGGSNNTVSHRYGGRDVMKRIIEVIKQEGYVYFDWNVDSTDASAYCQNKDKIVQAVLTQCQNKNKAIILMHDTDPKVTTVQALPEVIKGLKDQGFSFEVITKDTPIRNFN